VDRPIDVERKLSYMLKNAMSWLVQLERRKIYTVSYCENHLLIVHLTKLDSKEPNQSSSTVLLPTCPSHVHGISSQNLLFDILYHSVILIIKFFLVFLQKYGSMRSIGFSLGSVFSIEKFSSSF
jgi:hypothetical protein